MNYAKSGASARASFLSSAFLSPSLSHFLSPSFLLPVISLHESTFRGHFRISFARSRPIVPRNSARREPQNSREAASTTCREYSISRRHLPVGMCVCVCVASSALHPVLAADRRRRTALKNTIVAPPPVKSGSYRCLHLCCEFSFRGRWRRLAASVHRVRNVRR